jgi:hypothetical protein
VTDEDKNRPLTQEQLNEHLWKQMEQVGIASSLYNGLVLRLVRVVGGDPHVRDYLLNYADQMAELALRGEVATSERDKFVALLRKNLPAK